MRIKLDKSTWQRLQFGDVIDSITDRVDNPSEAGVDRYVGLEHLDPGTLTVQRWDSPDKVEAQKLRFRPGDVIFGRRRAYQKKVAMAEFEGICSAHALVLRARPEHVDPHFLPIFLSSDYFLERAISISVGSLSPTVNWRDLKVQEFDLPSLDDQRRIADLLWAVERHRRNLVSGSLATQSIARVLSSQILNDYAWDTRLGDVLVGITAGRSLPGKSTPVGDPDTYGVLRVSAVSANGFVASENKQLIRQDDFLPQYAIRKGDLLITRANTSAYVGRPAIVDDNYENLMLSDKTLRLDPDPARTSVNFLREYLLTPRVREAIAVAATGTGAAMKNISQKDVRTLPMPRMSLSQQAEFLTQVGLLRATQQDVDVELSTLHTLKQALLENVLGDS